MAEPFLGEIRVFGFGYPPKSWALCNGQMLPVNQNQALYALLGNTYGGNTQSFALPDLRGRVPIYFGINSTGRQGGEPSHTLTTGEMPAHTHTLVGVSNAADSTELEESYLAQSTNGLQAYSTGTDNVGAINSGSILNNSGGQAHPNMQPYLVLNYCIALVGIFPSRN